MKKCRKQEESFLSSDYDKPAKRVKKVNVTNDFMYDPHVYMSVINSDEMNLSEDPSLPVETLPDQILSSTVSSTYILEALGAPISTKIDREKF